MTRNRIWLAILAALGTSLILAFLVPDVDARGRGGGGRSVSRGGAASRGSLSRGGSFGSRSSMQRPSSSGTRGQGAGRGTGRSSQQPRAEQRPSSSGTRAQDAGRGTGRSSERPRAEERPAEEGGRRDGGTRQDDRQEHQNENREDWQNHLEQQQNERLAYADHWQDEYMEGVVRYPYGYGYPYPYGATSISISITNLESSGCKQETVVVEGSTYYRCDTTWYRKAYTDRSVSYVEVRAPPGH